MEACGLCGGPFRPEEGEEGYCPACLEETGLEEEEVVLVEWAEADDGPWS